MTASTIAIAAKEAIGHDDAAAGAWSIEEWVLLGRMLIFVGVFVLAVMTFGYAGAIVMAIASTVLALSGLVYLTTTGLR